MQVKMSYEVFFFSLGYQFDISERQSKKNDHVLSRNQATDRDWPNMLNPWRRYCGFSDENMVE